VTAVINPQRLSQPFACWTLDRPETHLNEEEKNDRVSRIDVPLITEGQGTMVHRMGHSRVCESQGIMVMLSTALLRGKRLAYPGLLARSQFSGMTNQL
jgi:hypothetical protein